MAEPEVTRAGVLLGTAPYMSPGTGGGTAGRSALGPLLARRRVLRDADRPAALSRAIGGAAAELDPSRRSAAACASRTEIIPEIEDVVGRCLRKEPSHRWASAADVHQSLVDIRRRLLSDAARQDSGRTAAVARPRASWLDSRWALSAILVLLWLVNWIETGAEDAWSTRTGDWIGYQFAAAFQWFEGALSFEGHDAAGPVAVYLGSIAYFFLPVVLLALTLVALVPRRSVSGYRQFTFAIMACYVLSLPFYLGVPVPERWAYPESHAVLLSDLWSTRLIETIRPISGLDNCFPSFHVSGTFALVLTWYRLRLRFRHAIACLGAAVALSTVFLGIHWLADIVAGFALAVIAVKVAAAMERRFSMSSPGTV